MSTTLPLARPRHRLHGGRERGKARPKAARAQPGGDAVPGSRRAPPPTTRGAKIRKRFRKRGYSSLPRFGAKPEPVFLGLTFSPAILGLFNYQRTFFHAAYPELVFSRGSGSRPVTPAPQPRRCRREGLFLLSLRCRSMVSSRTEEQEPPVCSCVAKGGGFGAQIQLSGPKLPHRRGRSRGGVREVARSSHTPRAAPPAAGFGSATR